MKKLLVFILFLSSCQKNYLWVEQEWIDQRHLASYFVQSPDPKLRTLKEGKKIIIYWKIPSKKFQKNSCLFFTAKFWDQTEKFFTYPLKKNSGYTTFFFPKKLKLYTYQIQLLDEKNQIIENWKHQLWTEPIRIKNL